MKNMVMHLFVGSFLLVSINLGAQETWVRDKDISYGRNCEDNSSHILNEAEASALKNVIVDCEWGDFFHTRISQVCSGKIEFICTGTAICKMFGARVAVDALCACRSDGPADANDCVANTSITAKVENCYGNSTPRIQNKFSEGVQ